MIISVIDTRNCDENGDEHDSHEIIVNDEILLNQVDTVCNVKEGCNSVLNESSLKVSMSKCQEIMQRSHNKLLGPYSARLLGHHRRYLRWGVMTWQRLFGLKKKKGRFFIFFQNLINSI